MKEIHDKARQLMKGYCRVCPVCDGRACAGEVPGMGGLGTGASFRSNMEDLARLKFNMRLIHEVRKPDTSVEILGRTLRLPVLAAPIGGVSFNMGGGVTEDEYIEAVLGGCLDAGLLGCVGDGVPEFILQSGLRGIEKFGGAGIPFIKPWESAELDEKLRLAAATGADIFGMDIDAAGLVTLRKQGRPVGPMGPERLAALIARTPGKFILKGVMTPEEASMAADAGASAIVVSNHGGRVLDHAPGTARVLPAIARTVGGRLTILVDGGIRSGGDVLKMLALGADAVMIGRPVAVAAVGGQRPGVAAYFERIGTELRQAMGMTGTARVSEVDQSILYDHEEQRSGQ